MSIANTEIVTDIISGGVRQIVFRCTDSVGGTHDYGPLFTVDQDFDVDAHKVIVADKVATRLADQELEQVVG